MIAAGVGASCALVPSIVMWDFTVDDALVSVRYAHDLAVGAGYRFDPRGPSTDGVTPLPWPFLLAPFARGDALATLAAAKGLGVAAWTLAAAALGVRAARIAGLGVAAAGMVVTGLAFPIGAWAASGMETGVATSLATLAAVALGRPRVAALLAGLAAALRPELVPWAVALAIGAAGISPVGDRREDPRRALAGAAIALGPFAACAALRLAIWGRAAPLALLAKPSDLSHGAVYAAAAAIAILTPVFVSLRPGARGLTVAFVVHLASTVAVGGDWMPYARLVVPVAPSLVVAFAAAQGASARASRVGLARAGGAARVVIAAALGVALAIRAAPAGRHVQRDREELIALARPALASSRVIAALDIGWVSAASDARIVDLAGLTDPTIAALGGGHTSKRVDTAMLLDRGVDTVLVYSEPRVVEARLVSSELFRRRFEKRGSLPLGAHAYDVYSRAGLDVR